MFEKFYYLMKSCYKSNVPAFTLWELMIAMLITSLIVALSYGAYWKFTMILKQESAHAELMHGIRLLERELYQLTQGCNTITREGEVLVFEFPDNIYYLEFSDSTMLLVQEGNSDDCKFTLNNQYSENQEFPVEAWTSGYLNQHSEHIDRFQIKCRADQQVYNLSFKKTYTNRFLYSLKQP